MQIQKHCLSDDQRKMLPDENQLGFGIHFTDHMFLMDYEHGKGWHDPRIVPYGPIMLDPAAACLHYAQEIFEGLKAYRGVDGKTRLFRAKDNVKRLNRSAVRMCIPELDEGIALNAIRELVKVDERWIPASKGTSLYIRPFIFANEPFLGVRPAKKYIFCIILSPVAAYYKEGFSPVKIYVTDKYARAAKGGTGEAKAAANYAASLMASEEAKAHGFTQVLWLDAAEKRYIEEVGTMNIFFAFDDALVTPSLSGSILAGITRDSTIKLALDWGLKVEERPVTIDEAIEKAQQGRLKECFGTGTAAVISPVGSLHYKDKDYVINGATTGKLAQKLFDELTGIQYGERPDHNQWTEIL